MPSWARIIELPARVWRKTVEVGPLYALQLIYWEIFPSWLFDLNVWIVTVKEIQAYSEIRNHDSAIRWADENDMDALTLCGLNRTKIASSFERDGKIEIIKAEKSEGIPAAAPVAGGVASGGPCEPNRAATRGKIARDRLAPAHRHRGERRGRSRKTAR